MLFRKRSIYLIPLLVLASALLGGVYGPRMQVAAAASTDDDLKTSMKDFTNLYSTVEQNFAEPVNPDKAIYNGAIPSMLRTLDPHSNFYDPKTLKSFRDDQRGKYYGVGMVVQGRNGQTIVQSPFVGSPAYLAGLRPNDVIIEVNDKSTTGLTSTEVADLLRGPRGTPVQIKVSREGADGPVVFNLVRDEIKRPSVPLAYMIKPGIGYIQLDQFIETSGQEITDALKKLDEPSLKGLVLDLRGNPGGLLDQAVSIVDHFVPKGATIVSHHGRQSRDAVYTAKNGNHGLSYPIVAIVNRNSASAAEILSGALQDHDRAWILGENTFGKGLVQTVFPIIEDTGLALTTAKYYTPSGRLIQRDYSNVSFYDYYSRKDTRARNTADVKMTDGGRTVYGGGGISPDEEFKPAKYEQIEIDLIVKSTYPNYTKHFFALHKDPLPKGWNVDAAQMATFKTWLQDQKFEFSEADFTKNYENIRRTLQQEIYKTAFNVDESARYGIDTDPEVAAAIAALPKAQSLLSTAKKLTAERMQK